MSTVSENQNMAQPNQQDNSYDPSATSVKRKRGRPRKEAASGSEPNKRRKQWTVLPSSSSYDGLVGQEVSCSFIGVFDAGYLLTVRVGGSGPILTGLVFDPRLSVPVSAENDIAPHLPMLRRNDFSPPVEEGFINQAADSSQAGTAQNAGNIQPIQAKESPTTSSFTSHEQTDLQPNMMEVTPSQNSHVPQTTSETMETQNIPKTFKVFLEGPATETSDQLASSHHPQSQAKSEHAPISAGLSDVSMEAPASKPSNGYNPSVLPMVTSSEVSKPSNASDPSESPVTVPNTSSEPLNIPKEALPATTEASVDNSKEAPHVVLKPSKALADAQKITSDEQKSSDLSALEATDVLQNQPLKTGDFPAANLSLQLSSQRTEEPSEDPEVDESVGDGGNRGGAASSGLEQE